jgi:hypothetical protein
VKEVNGFLTVVWDLKEGKQIDMERFAKIRQLVESVETCII